MNPTRRSFKWVRSLSEQVRGLHRSALTTLWRKYREAKLAEIEALEACKWLRAAGFPQYAQMYEDLQFPIDIASVEKDHDFLDRDSIQSLFRRLNILNKCAAMKIDAPPRKSVDESDEEDQCALSDKWKFQRSCRRWSRKDLEQLQLDDGADKPGIRSSSSHDSVLTDNESLSQHGDSPLLNKKTSQEKPDLRSAKSPLSSRRSAKLPSNSPQMLLCSDTSDTEQRLGGSRSPVSPRLKRAASERLNRAKNFLKRMESLKTRKSKKVTKSSGDKVEISGPLVMNSQDMQDRMNRLGCVDISPSEENPPSGSSVVTRRQKRSDLNAPTEQNSDSDTSPSLAKRGGMVFMDSSFNPSAYSNVNETTKDEVTSNETSQKLNVPLGHKRTLSSSDAHDYAEVFEDQRSDSLPKIVSNGYIDVGNGSQINYRTGSFNLGSESDAFRENLRRTRGGSQDPNKLDSDKGECSENRLSVYDNVPTTGSDPQHELDLILHDLFQNINGLNQSLQSEVAPENSVEYQVNMVLDSSVPSSVAQAPNSPMSLSQEDGPVTDHKKAINTSGNLEQDNDHASGTSSNQEMSDADTPGSREDEGSDPPETRERRDSGVGSSLTRAPSDRRRPRIRWHSFVKSHRPSLNSRSLQINNMSAGQLMVLRKLSLLKVTALMEKYSPSNRSGWNWVVPKFIKRFKSPDYKDKNVFAVPLGIIFQRTGQPLPQCILYAMRCLRRTAQDAVGIFRKSGVRSRIQKLRNQIEANPDSVDFESLQAYDVADLLKQYFRELPECLLTNKLSETFISIYTHVPAEMRLEALQAAIMLMPDENRQVLQSLLLFLSDMAQHADRNQMNASNLAVCFAPSLFHLSGPRTNHAASPKRSRKNLGIPDQKELLEQKAAHECLTHMIVDCKKLFMIPEDMLSKCRFSYIEQGDPVSLDELSKKRTEDGTANYTAHIESCIQGLLKESRDKFKGWVSISSPNSTDLAYKKVGDGHPLRLWKSSVEVEAPPVEVLNRVLRERHVWDEDMLKWRTIERLDRETEVFQWVSNSMAPHPTRDFTELRSWRTALPKGACVLVSTSVEHADATPLGGVRGVVLASRYLIEPCGSGKSRLTHICRVDVRGHTVEWYNKSYGYLCANYMARIRDSFKQSMATTDGPETKV